MCVSDMIIGCFIWKSLPWRDKFPSFWSFFGLFTLLTNKKIKFSKNKNTKSRDNLILYMYTIYYNHWVFGMTVIDKYCTFSHFAVMINMVAILTQINFHVNFLIKKNSVHILYKFQVT